MKLLTGLKIVPLDKQVNKDSPSLNPKPPFTLQLCGAKAAGKSSTILNMLLNKNLLAGKFNKIYYISPTSKLDTKLNVLKESSGIIIPNKDLIKELKKNKKNVKICDDELAAQVEYNNCLTDDDFIQDCSVDFLKDLIKEQKYIIEKYSKSIADKILIIYDDCASEQKFFKSQTVQKMIFNSRHLNISVMYSVQNYTSLPKPLRLNNSIVILFETANKKEISLIYEENNGKLSFQEFYKMFMDVIATPFAFLTINYQNFVKYRFQESFERFIVLEE